MGKSTFREWTLTKLDRRFGLKQVRNHAALDEWTRCGSDISDFERKILLMLKERAALHVDYWNELEYSLYVIGQIISLADFCGENFNAFAGRYMSAVVDGEELSGNPDCLIASGRREPEIPYFCLQEYKKERDAEGDPAGQCLAAMLAAQTLNQNLHPVYGCYVQGRNWFFMVLQDKDYAITNSYTVTHDQIFDIFSILKNLKNLIIKKIED